MAKRTGRNTQRSNAQRSSAPRRNASAGRADARKRAEYKKKQRQKWIIRIITLLIVVALIVTLVLSVGSCNRDRGNEPAGSSSTEEQTTPEQGSGDEETPAAQTGRVTLTAVGDIIAHDTILELAKTGDSYDFSSLFSILKPDISRMDLAIANVETPLGGGPYIGYPAFNTPDEMGEAVIDAGFDVALQASNHSMDSGADGIHHGIDFWKKHTDEILMVGLHESQEEADEIPITTVNGIKFAVLNYTYGLNDYELPGDEQYLVTLMNDGTKDYISNQVKEADEKADFVIACPHWGDEGQVGAPNGFQEDWAELFTEAGADLIIGTHPHVIENIEWINADNGNKALCYYSLGNFVSNQQYTDLVLGAMAYVEIEKDADGNAVIVEDSAKAVPVVTHNDKTQTPTVIQTYYLADYTEELASVHDTLLTYDENFSLALLQQKAEDVLGKWMIDRLP